MNKFSTKNYIKGLRFKLLLSEMTSIGTSIGSPIAPIGPSKSSKVIKFNKLIKSKKSNKSKKLKKKGSQ
jgi:hypothetical protein